MCVLKLNIPFNRIVIIVVKYSTRNLILMPVLLFWYMPGLVYNYMHVYFHSRIEHKHIYKICKVLDMI